MPQISSLAFTVSVYGQPFAQRKNLGVIINIAFGLSHSICHGVLLIKSIHLFTYILLIPSAQHHLTEEMG